MSHAAPAPRPKFVLAEFISSDDMLKVTKEVRLAGEAVRKGGAAPEWARSVGTIDTHTPFPVHGIEEALGLPPSKVPWIVFGGAMTGSIGGFLMMSWMNHIAYPLNIGGRPSLSWPTQIPITFELGILLGGFGAFFGLMALMGLPRPYHPLFESDNFGRATWQNYFVSVEVAPGGDSTALADALRGMGATTVDVVEEAER